MNCLKIFQSAITTFCASAAMGVVHAQMPGNGFPGWNGAMTKLFGDVKAFSAKAEMRALDKAGKPSIQVPMDFALLDNQVRMDIDMTLLKGPQAPPDQVALLKQMSMDRVACIVTPEKKAMQLIFPA